MTKGSRFYAPRNHQCAVALTEAEKEIVLALAEKEGETASAYIRNVLLNFFDDIGVDVEAQHRGKPRTW